jgi:tetratricopeptide (TPR) repeat protein
MIVKNEAANLPSSLGPAAGLFDEIVVVDTGSIDGTAELARTMGARVVEIDWPEDFAAARNVSIEAARGDWILWLDADNSISAEDVELLRERLDSERRSIFWCTEVVVPEGERLIQKRVFPNRPEVRFEGRVHEQLAHPADFSSVITQAEVRHWGYADKAGAARKGERNLALLREMAAENPEDFYVRYQMGRTLLNLRRFEESAAWLGKAANDEDGARSNVGLARHAGLLWAKALERLGRRDEAEAHFKKMAEGFPDYGPARLAWGKVLHAKGDHAEAAGHLEAFLEKGASDPVAGFNPEKMKFQAAMTLGRCFEETGRLGEAGRAYLEGARVLPGHTEPPLALARLALKAGRGNDARLLLSRCLDISPDNPRATALMEEARRG